MNNTTINRLAELTIDFNIEEVPSGTIFKKLAANSAARKAHHAEIEAMVNALWEDYKQYKEEYMKIRESLYAQIKKNTETKLAKRAEKKTDSIDKTEAEIKKLQEKLEALKAKQNTDTPEVDQELPDTEVA